MVATSSDEFVETDVSINSGAWVDISSDFSSSVLEYAIELAEIG